MHIDHINIKAPHDMLSKLKAFYCDLFDLNVGFRPVFNSNSQGFWLYYNSNALIHLTESLSECSSNKDNHLDHIAFQITGLSDFILILKRMGIDYTVDNLLKIGMTQLFFSDPVGNGLEANFVNEIVSSDF